MDLPEILANVTVPVAISDIGIGEVALELGEHVRGAALVFRDLIASAIEGGDHSVCPDDSPDNFAAHSPTPALAIAMPTAMPRPMLTPMVNLPKRAPRNAAIPLGLS
jgi:hypothetical protein